MDDLLQHVNQLHKFRGHGWLPDEMHSFGVCYANSMWVPCNRTTSWTTSRSMRLHLVSPIHIDTDSDDDTAMRAGSDESDPEGDDATGPWRMETSRRRAMQHV